MFLSELILSLLWSMLRVDGFVGGFFEHPCAKFEQISTAYESAEIFHRKQKRHPKKSVTSLPNFKQGV